MYSLHLTICNISNSPFWVFWGWIWVLIASVSDLCIYFPIRSSNEICKLITPLAIYGLVQINEMMKKLDDCIFIHTFKQLLTIRITCKTNHKAVTKYTNIPIVIKQYHSISYIRRHLSRVVRKPAFCIWENKAADQLRSNCAADQRLCFHYIESTIPLFP